MTYSIIGILAIVNFIAMVLFIGVQVFYPLLPFYAMGYMIGSCLLHSFVLEDEKASLCAGRHENYDLILIDWKMPEMDGMEADQVYPLHEPSRRA